MVATSEQTKREKRRAASSRRRKKGKVELITIDQAAKRTERDLRREAGTRRLLNLPGAQNVDPALRATVANIPGSAKGTPEARRALALFRRQAGIQDITDPGFVAEQLRAGAVRDPSQAAVLSARAAKFQARADARGTVPPPTFDRATLAADISSIEESQGETRRRLVRDQQGRDQRRLEDIAGRTPAQTAGAREGQRERGSAERISAGEQQTRRREARLSVREARGEGAEAAQFNAEAVAQQGAAQREHEAEQNALDRQAAVDERNALLNPQNNNPDIERGPDGTPLIDQNGELVVKQGSATEFKKQRADSIALGASETFDAVSGKGLFNRRGGEDASRGLNNLADQMESVPEDERDFVRSSIIEKLVAVRPDFRSVQEREVFDIIRRAIEEYDTQGLRALTVNLDELIDRAGRFDPFFGTGLKNR